MDEKDMEQEGQNEKKGWGIENKMVFFLEYDGDD
jgi:hypothetical protein